MHEQAYYTTPDPDRQTGVNTYIGLERELHALETLTELQSTAYRLYTQGFNVLPLYKHSKKPFVLEPFFTSRLHHCSPLCAHAGRDDIMPMFKGHNLGLVTGRTSGNLVAVDCDSRPAFVHVGRELEKQGLPFWAYTSHRGGGYLLRVTEGECASVPGTKSEIRDVEIWGNRHYVVIPPSIHESGELYTWERLSEDLPFVSVDSLSWLGVRLAKESQPYQEPDLYGLPQWAKVLSLKNRQTFGEELTEGERNIKLFALACDMAGNEIPYYDAERVITEKSRQCGLSDKETKTILKSAYRRGRTAARKYLGDAPVKEWERAQDFAVSYDWKATFGRKAATRKTTYLACVERAKKDGRAHWRATVREIAELVGTGVKSAWLYMSDLERAGLIRQVSKPNQMGVYRFVLTDYSIYTGSYSVVNCDSEKLTMWKKEIPTKQGEQDVFKKLGRVAWGVWRYLLRTDANSIAEIARNTGYCRQSVSRALRLLTHTNVRLVSTSEGVYSGEPVGSDEALQKRAVYWYDGSSPSKARKEKHTLERERRVNRLTVGAIRKAGEL